MAVLFGGFLRGRVAPALGLLATALGLLASLAHALPTITIVAEMSIMSSSWPTGMWSVGLLEKMRAAVNADANMLAGYELRFFYIDGRCSALGVEEFLKLWILIVILIKKESIFLKKSMETLVLMMLFLLIRTGLFS